MASAFWTEVTGILLCVPSTMRIKPSDTAGVLNSQRTKTAYHNNIFLRIINPAIIHKMLKPIGSRNMGRNLLIKSI